MVIHKESVDIHQRQDQPTEDYHIKLKYLQAELKFRSKKKEKAVWIRIDTNMDEFLKELVRIKYIPSVSELIRKELEQFISTINIDDLV